MDQVISINLLGDIAAGKGTQAKLLAERFDLKLLDTGSYSRKMLTGQSKVGHRLERVKLGKLAPSDIIQDYLRKSLEKLPENKGLLLDGAKMPAEAKLVYRILKKQKRKVLVLYLSIPKKEIFHRLLFRYYDKKTGKPMILDPKEAESRKYRGKVIKRADDDERAIKNRISYYDKVYSKTIAFWKEKGLLKKIDGNQPVKDVTRDLVTTIEEYYELD